MDFGLKRFRTLKNTKYLRTNDLFFFFDGVNQKSNEWVKVEQNLNNEQLGYHKVFNRSAVKVLGQSIFREIKSVVNGTTFYIKPIIKTVFLHKRTLTSKLEPFLLSIIAIKLNNKAYSSQQLKTVMVLKYETTKLALYQFSVANIKYKNCLSK